MKRARRISGLHYRRRGVRSTHKPGLVVSYGGHKLETPVLRRASGVYFILENGKEQEAPIGSIYLTSNPEKSKLSRSLISAYETFSSCSVKLLLTRLKS
ncbi:unnamed protein product [Nesidiocoris tenuis]|uniref:Uncharacterized protein n=1 Tax=Nesidiocoris tenuis TaxID=355587 RepID=A0A6H5GPV8_9HEMI|nr:unnamed protein product [Nesidiocoris tenuis]